MCSFPRVDLWKHVWAQNHMYAHALHNAGFITALSLRAGDSVFVCSRNDASVKAVVSELSDRYGTDRVAGAACDVSKAAEVKAIVEHASTSVGDIDIWINNAGSNAYSFKPLVEADETDLVDIVQTNVLGVMICCQVRPFPPPHLQIYRTVILASGHTGRAQRLRSTHLACPHPVPADTSAARTLLHMTCRHSTSCPSTHTT